MFGLDVRWPHDCVSSCCCCCCLGWGGGGGEWVGPKGGHLWRGYSTWIWMGWLCVSECVQCCCCCCYSCSEVSAVFRISLSLSLSLSQFMCIFPIWFSPYSSLCLFLENVAIFWSAIFPTWLNYVANSRNFISRPNWQPAPLLIHAYCWLKDKGVPPHIHTYIHMWFLKLLS